MPEFKTKFEIGDEVYAIHNQFRDSIQFCDACQGWGCRWIDGTYVGCGKCFNGITKNRNDGTTRFVVISRRIRAVTYKVEMDNGGLRVFEDYLFVGVGSNWGKYAEDVFDNKNEAIRAARHHAELWGNGATVAVLIKPESE